MEAHSQIETDLEVTGIHYLNIHYTSTIKLLRILSSPSASEVSFYKHPSLESNDKAQLGSYTPEERRKRIERFLEKRKLRVWTKRVKYDVRKNLADSRVRVRGRFVKKEELSSAVGDIIMENT